MIQWVIAMAAVVAALLLAAKWMADRLRKAARGISPSCESCSFKSECGKYSGASTRMLRDRKSSACEKSHTTTKK